MSFKIIEGIVGLDTRYDVDKDIKNKWVQNWLLEKDVYENFVLGKVQS